MFNRDDKIFCPVRRTFYEFLKASEVIERAFVVAVFDCFMFWLWGNSFTSIFLWCVFGFEIIRVIIASVLFFGVKQGSLWKCKTFCIAEFILLCCKVIVLVMTLDVIGRLIYTALMVVLRLFGIRIIAGFIAKLQIETGEVVSFPWMYIQASKEVDNNPNEPTTPLKP